MSVDAPIANAARVIPGRECGSCSLCCKVYAIPEINKPVGKWCTQCKPGRGCLIHDALPAQCAQFECLWRTQETIGAVWKPDQARMVLTVHPMNGYIQVQVDANSPSAWQKQPYHGQLRQWARNNLPKGIYVLVYLNENATLILPDQDLPMGPMRPVDGIAVQRSGNAYEARVIPGAFEGRPMPAPGHG